MEKQNKECCLTCYTCEIGELLHDNTDNTKKPCKHYPKNMSAKGEFLQVYRCEHYKPIIHHQIIKKKLDKNQKKRYKALKSMEDQMAKMLESIGFKKVKVVDYKDIIIKAEIRAFMVGFFIGVVIGISLLTALIIIIGV